MFDFIRACAAVPAISVGNVRFNTEKIIEKIDEAKEQGAGLIVFPELSVTGYTAADLFFQDALLKEVKPALNQLAEQTCGSEIIVVVGAPLLIDGRLYNTAIVLSEGEISGIVPKTFLPNGSGFSEKRWFSPSTSLKCDSVSAYDMGFSKDYDYEIPVGCDLIFSAGGLNFGIELCEDMWAPVSRGTILAMSGAEVICNLSACPDIAGRQSVLETVIKSETKKNVSAYIYASAGAGESTADSIYTGDSLIAECGRISAKKQSYKNDGYILACDLDIGKIKAERLKKTSFADCSDLYVSEFRTVELSKIKESDGTLYKYKKFPFVPQGENADRRCIEIFNLQSAGLARRLEVLNSKAVIGVSGGLDSTLALLVCANAAKLLGKAPDSIIGVTMPGFGTTSNTKSNAQTLMENLGICQKSIPITNACRVHFEDIGHNEADHSTVYENAQARERTQILMDIANASGGIVIGTGDLSEIALGWSTYNGDHMSMYAVNSSVPKTLIVPLIKSVIKENLFPSCNCVLEKIIETPISPELLPPDEKGEIAQKTEEIVGPYPLHDFFLFYVVRYGFSPSKIYHIAKIAFADEYNSEAILKWLKLFYRRFFTQQFKRNCSPDGVGVGTVSLSPRDGFKMPSDASYSLWISELENLE